MDLTPALPPDVTGFPPAQLLANASEQDIEALLDEQNLRRFNALGHSVAYLLALAICGLLGNTLVFVVYLLRLKTYPMRAYIMAMSVCDFLTNCFSLPMEVLEIRIHFTFSSAALCSVSWTVMCFLLLFSGALLAAVAYDRQVLVCQRHRGKSRRRVNRDRNFLLVCFALSLLVSLPWLGSLELQAVDLPGTGLQGTTCAFVKGSVLAQVMNYVNNGLFVAGLVIICYSYGRIARRLREHRQQKKKKTTAQGCLGAFSAPAAAAAAARSTGFSQNETSLEIDVTETSQRLDSADSAAAEEEAVDGDRPPVTSAACLEQQPNTGALPTHDTGTCPKAGDGSFPRKVFSLQFFQNSHLVWKEGEGEKGKAKVAGGGGSRKRISNRTTLMLFVLSVVFCLNYVPYLAIVVQRNIQSEEAVIETLGLNVYYILIRSLYINSAINPIVYGIYSPRFRRECVGFFCCRA